MKEEVGSYLSRCIDNEVKNEEINEETGFVKKAKVTED